MGIEYVAWALGIHSNHSVASLDERCVRFSCEKHCHTSQRQPMRPLVPGIPPWRQLLRTSVIRCKRYWQFIAFKRFLDFIA